MKFDKSVYTTFMLVSQLGLSMIVPILGCTYGGMWLEEKFQIPITIPFIILGILAGIRNCYELVCQAKKNTEENVDEER